MSRLAFAIVFLVAAIFSSTLCAEHPNGPNIPALIVGGNQPQSFIVEGVTRFSKQSALGFYEATDGQKQVCAVYDSSDNTPLILSDGRETLIYDLSENRIVCLPRSTAHVRVDWDPTKDKPLNFKIGVSCRTNSEVEHDDMAWFRIDRFVEASGELLRRAESDASCERYQLHRDSGKIESIEVDPQDSSWFRFASRESDQDYCRFEMNARSIGQTVPNTALVFPDSNRLAWDFMLVEIDSRRGPALVDSLLHDGHGWIAKLALAAGEEMQKTADSILASPDWEILRSRDHELGSKYKAALAEQRVQFQMSEEQIASRPRR